MIPEQEYEAQNDEESSEYSVDLEPYPEDYTQQLSQGMAFYQGNSIQRLTLLQLSSDSGSTWIPFNKPYEAPKLCLMMAHSDFGKA